MELSLGRPTSWKRRRWGCCRGTRRTDGSYHAPGSLRSPAMAPGPARPAPPAQRSHPRPGEAAAAGEIQAGAGGDGTHGLPSMPLSQMRTPALTQHSLRPRGSPPKPSGQKRRLKYQLTSHPGLDKGYELLGPAWSRAGVRSGQGWRASFSPGTTIPRSLWALPDFASQQVGA